MIMMPIMLASVIADDCVGCIDKVDPAQPLVFPAIFEGIIVEIY